MGISLSKVGKRINFSKALKYISAMKNSTSRKISGGYDFVYEFLFRSNNELLTQHKLKKLEEQKKEMEAEIKRKKEEDILKIESENKEEIQKIQKEKDEYKESMNNQISEINKHTNDIVKLMDKATKEDVSMEELVKLLNITQ